MNARLRLLALFALIAGAASCDGPGHASAPLRTTPSRDLLSQPVLIAPVTRTTPLSTDVTWTFTAGPAGAVSSNAAVGLTISIPAGALAADQQITVTAFAGAPVAYGFSPHLTFAQPAVLTQTLQGTSAASLLSILSGAHFDGDSLQLSASGLALVNEIVPAMVNSLTQTVSVNVGHFSGWIIATGDTSTTSDTTSSGSGSQ